MSVAVTWQHRARRRLRRLAEHLGSRGLAGIGLVLAAVALFALEPRFADDARRLQDETAALQTRIEKAKRRTANNPEFAQHALRLREWLPPVESATADLRTVFGAARKHKLDLSKGEYSLSSVGEGARVRRYQVVLPVRNDYTAIKYFIAEVLDAIPHASLAELRLERGSASVEELDARVHFTLFYRDS